jgi:hypothetical protein
MNRLILQLSFRESAVWAIPIVLAIFGYTVFGSAPLRYFDNAFALLGAALGGVLGFRVFWDGGGVRPFLFSRTFSPTRLFMVRWLYGIAVLCGTWIIVAIIIGGGLRQAVQVGCFQSGWYPMVRSMELQSLMTLASISLLFYQTTVFWVIRYRFLGKRRYKGVSLWFRYFVTIVLSIFVLIYGGLLLMFVGSGLFWSGYVGFSRALMFPFLLIFALPAVLQTVFVPLCGRYCYTNQEIES